VQNIALALHDMGILAGYYTTGADNFGTSPFGRLRREVGAALPGVDRRLSRRRITSVPEELIHPDWTWDLPRTAASMLGADARVTDWFWDRSEKGLDARCARAMEGLNFDAFFGIEYGALATARVCQQLGKPVVLGLLSPHHSLREQWVDPEYERFPELLTPAARRLMELAHRRDRRRDEETQAADVIFINSSLSRRSLEQAGFAEKRFITVLNGAPSALADTMLPTRLAQPLRFIYAGSVAVHKGVQYLLEAWRQLRPTTSAELHLYGTLHLPKRIFQNCGDNVFFHGRVSGDRLSAAYREAAALVFPTLYDGFGLVVTEALAQGLPVLTTSNAGAAEVLDEGSTGFVVPAANAEALAERMEWCLTHPRQLVQMRPHALAAARALTWARYRSELRQQLTAALTPPALEKGA